MAFNPFSHFHKYKKVFMALSVLLCMVTFVLCSGGMKGMGLDDLILRIFGRRGGEVLVEVNGVSYYYEQLDEIKKQRAVANDFMRELLKIAVDRLESQVKQTEANIKGNQNAAFRLSLLQQCLTDLQTKLDRSPRFFFGGTKLEDMVDFICWRDLADKNGVSVTDDALASYVRYACHAFLWDSAHEDVRAALQEVMYVHIRNTHYNATQGMVDESLRQEFRVQIIQLATMARWLPTDSREKDANIPDGRGDNVHIYLNTPLQFRIAPTPEQLNARYVKSRTEMTIELLPISLEQLAQKVKLPEDLKERTALLKKFYDKYEKAPYNPAGDTPGFQFPAQAKIQYLTANAGMEYYKRKAQELTALQQLQRVVFDPLSPLTELGTFVANQPSWEARLLKNLEDERESYKFKALRHFQALASANERYWTETNEKTKDIYKLSYELELQRQQEPYKNSASPLTTTYFYSPGQFNLALEKPSGPTAAAAVAGVQAGPFAALAAYQSAAYGEQAKKIAPMAPLARVQRAKAGAELFLARVPEFLGTGAFTAAAMTYQADWTPQFLPVAGYVEANLQAKAESQLAQGWVNETMLDVKKQLESAKGENAFRAQIEKMLDKYTRKVKDKSGEERTVSGLSIRESPDWRSEYDVEYDKDLKPLFDAFQKYRFYINTVEGRTGPEFLKEGDFGKLFFGTETFGVGPLGGTFKPKIWPPNVTAPKARQTLPLAQKSLEQRPFDFDENPIIFWKSAKRDKDVKPWKPDDPKSLEFVEMQYRLQQARSELLPKVKKLAEEIRKVQRSENTNLVAKLRELAEQQGVKVVTLPNVSMLVANTDVKTSRDIPYTNYELPRGRIPYPRGDMVKQLLALPTLTAPLTIDLEEPEKKGKSGETDPGVKRAKADFDEINKLNAELFLKPSEYKAKLPQVQVLTNQPRDVVYLAVVSGVKEPRNLEYLKDVLPEFSMFGGVQPTFADQVQQDFGKELAVLMAKYLREKAGVSITAKAKSQFGDEPAPQGSQ